MINKLDIHVLLLNQNFIPLTVCNARRAIIMVLAGKAEIIETTEFLVHSVTRSFTVPSIIKLVTFIRVPRHWRVQLSKQNILRRDRGICQYCGKMDIDMTIDHILPRSHGGDETWENLVCACSDCNNKKGDRTPQEACMNLLKQPKKPNFISFLISHRIPTDDTWGTYIKFG